MSLGIYMASQQNFMLAPVHAHVNLLGWVTMALYGLWYRGAEIASPRLAWTQAISATVGLVVMVISLALVLTTGNLAYEAAIGFGAVFTVLGMMLFLAQVLTEGRRARVARPAVA